ncbi:MAG: cation-transporting P-type ATPase [Desulfobulbaceae bacterium]|nr:cation-transporting P-type ATPase [Desulfobulbaceae bacterium]
MDKETAARLARTPLHSLPAETILAELATSTAGLARDEAKRRLKDVGPNRLPPPPRESLLKRFFKHFHDLLIYILLAAGFVTAVLGHWVDTGVILGVVCINAIIGFLQEGKAEEALQGIRKMLSVKAHVRRDRQWGEIDAGTLVPGDIVRLRSGDRVPADLRLLEAANLRIEESALTGESVPSSKKIDPADEDAGIGDRHCLAYSGTMVTAGHGVGVVGATGPNTELGRISTMISEVQRLETPLTREMRRFGTVLSIAILTLALVMVVVGRLLHGYGISELFLAAIGFAVAAIPEGLPAILTITLALGVQRMARRNAITRKLNAVETLGSVTVICSDKTGTLTRNEMTARHVVTRAGRFDVEGTGYAPEGSISLDGRDATLEDHGSLQALVEVMAVCNDAELRGEEGVWSVLGEPTEGALRTLAQKTVFDETSYDRLAVVPFESDNKFMATLNRLPGGGRRILLKGAPDRLLDRSTHQLEADGTIVPLDRAVWEERIEALGAEGLRVLAAARREVEEETDTLAVEDVQADMVFLGLVGIIDPPRPEAIEAIRSCRQAGIRVVMITGDHAGTASAIAREMGISDDGRAVTGAELEAATDEQLQELVKGTVVFARTSPEHKLRLVKALQANGEVVAMTGDGVNDAPALKRADVGVAMGIKGTEATKEAAEIVLADDNFQSIERAVEEGRTIYDNLRKAILFILPTNGAEGLVMLAAVTFGLVLPLTPVQILWVNMVTAVTLAVALAFEPAEADVMARPPRRSDAPILDGYFLWRIFFVSVLIGGATIAVFLVGKENGLSLELARTLAVNTLVFGQLFYLFNSRHLRTSSLRRDTLLANRVAWGAAVVLLWLQITYVYAPFMHTLFGSAPLAPWLWLIPVGIGAAVFFLVELEKKVVARRVLNR